eukprot:633905-Rhodomonas_salina.2
MHEAFQLPPILSIISIFVQKFDSEVKIARSGIPISRQQNLDAFTDLRVPVFKFLSCKRAVCPDTIPIPGVPGPGVPDYREWRDWDCTG